MKKYVSLLLVLMTIFTLVSCGVQTKESSAPPATSNTSSDETKKEETKKEETKKEETKKEETKVYGIGEAAEANGLSITIDKVETAEPNTMLEKAKDGFAYVKVWFTFKNVSDETIDSPDRKDIYIVYEEGPTGDDCDMTSDDNSQVMLDVADRDQRYMEDIELTPGEATGGWMIYQRQADKSEISMHYYSGFINVAPDLMFSFVAK